MCSRSDGNQTPYLITDLWINHSMGSLWGWKPPSAEPRPIPGRQWGSPAVLEPAVAHTAQHPRVPAAKAKATPSTAAVSTAWATAEHTAWPGHPRPSLPWRSLQTLPFPFGSLFSCFLEELSWLQPAEVPGRQLQQGRPGPACSVLLTIQLSPSQQCADTDLTHPLPHLSTSDTPSTPTA